MTASAPPQVVSPKLATSLFLSSLIIPLVAAYGVASYGMVTSAYPWFVLVHIWSLLAFMLSHGAPALIAVRLPAADPKTSMAYLNLARDKYVILAMGATLGLVLSTGVSLGFFGGYWNRGWIWATLVGAIVVTFSMSFLGRRQFDKALKALQDGAQVRRGTPGAAAAVGFIGLFLILWMVLFKPF